MQNISKILWNKTKERAVWKMVLNKIWYKWIVGASSKKFLAFCILRVLRIQVLSVKAIKEARGTHSSLVATELMEVLILLTTIIWPSPDRTLKSLSKALNPEMVDWMIIWTTIHLFIIIKFYFRTLITQ